MIIVIKIIVIIIIIIIIIGTLNLARLKFSASHVYICDNKGSEIFTSA